MGKILSCLLTYVRAVAFVFMACVACFEIDGFASDGPEREPLTAKCFSIVSKNAVPLKPSPGLEWWSVNLLSEQLPGHEAARHGALDSSSSDLQAGIF